MSVFLGLGEKTCQESSSGGSEANNKGRDGFIGKNDRKVMAGLICLSLSDSEFWSRLVFLEKAKLLIMSWVLLSTFLAFVIWALIKEVVISTIDKALNIICDKWGNFSRLVNWFSSCLMTFISFLDVAVIHSSNTSFILLVIVSLVVSISWRIMSNCHASFQIDPRCSSIILVICRIYPPCRCL